MREQWRFVPKSRMRYEVSSRGRVRSLWLKSKPRILILKPSPGRKGYLRVSIAGKIRLISRLVLEAFVGPAPCKMHAAHLDGNINNNWLSNLKWCSPSENHKHKWLHGTATIGERHGCAKLTAKQVLKIRKRYKKRPPNFVWGNTSELAKEFCVNNGTILKIVGNKQWRIDAALETK